MRTMCRIVWIAIGTGCTSEVYAQIVVWLVCRQTHRHTPAYFVIKIGKYPRSDFVDLIDGRPYEKTEIGFLIVPGFEVPKLGLLFPAILNLLDLRSKSDGHR